MSVRWWTATDHTVWPADKKFVTASYATWQTEECPTTKRLHTQAIVQFNSKVRLSTVRQALSDTAHWEPVQNIPACIAYCQKEDTRKEGPWCHGINPLLPRKRKTVDTSLSLKDLALEHPFRVKQLKELKGVLTSPRNHSCQGIWITGETGTGKSKIAHLIGSFMGDYYVKDSTKWWDCYDSERLVILDDYRGEWQPQELLTTIDRYPKRVEYKGGYTQLKAAMVIITSNRTLDECYNTDLKTKQALRRRIIELTI